MMNGQGQRGSQLAISRLQSPPGRYRYGGPPIGLARMLAIGGTSGRNRRQVHKMLNTYIEAWRFSSISPMWSVQLQVGTRD